VEEANLQALQNNPRQTQKSQDNIRSIRGKIRGHKNVLSGLETTK